MPLATREVKERKPRQASRTNFEWEAYKAEIQNLYVVRGWGLKEVMAHFASHRRFHATTKMWKTRLGRWGFNVKHNRKATMSQAALHYQSCLEKGLPFLFKPAHHKAIDEQELFRYAERKGYHIVEGKFQVALADSWRITTQQGQVHITNPNLEPFGGSRLDVDKETVDHTTCDTIYLGGRISQSVSVNTSAFLSTSPTDCKISASSTHPVYPASEEPQADLFLASFQKGNNFTISATPKGRPSAQAWTIYLSQPLSVMPTMLEEPDEHQSHETCLLALNVTFISSYNAGRWRVGMQGFEVVNEQSPVAARLSDKSWELMLQAYRVQATAPCMHQARELFTTGLRYICFALVYNPAFALRDLLALLDEVNSRGGYAFAKMLLWYIVQWTRRSSYVPPELRAFFEALHHINQQDFRPVLGQAFKVSCDTLAYLVGGDSVNAQRRRLWPLQLGVSSQPEDLIETLLLHLADLRETPQPTIMGELACLGQIATSYFEDLRDFTRAAAFAGEALQLLEQSHFRKPHSLPYSVISEVYSVCLWEQGCRHEAIEWAETAAAALREEGAPPSDTHGLLELCKDWHHQLQNEYSTSVYAQLQSDAWSVIEKNVDLIDTEFREIKLEDGERTPGHRSHGSRSPQSAASSTTAAAETEKEKNVWKQGVMDQQSLFIYDSGGGGDIDYEAPNI